MRRGGRRCGGDGGEVGKVTLDHGERGAIFANMLDFIFRHH